jgi:virginiamycin B lyase
VFEEVPLPTAAAGPQGVAAGPNGEIWFTESSVGKVGRLTPNGALAEFPTPTLHSEPASIALDRSGVAWFTEYGPPGTPPGVRDHLGRVTQAGTVTEYALPLGQYGGAGIAFGPRGDLWFTELVTNAIGRVDAF